jgi:hypothetical protein
MPERRKKYRDEFKTESAKYRADHAGEEPQRSSDTSHDVTHRHTQDQNQPHDQLPSSKLKPRRPGPECKCVSRTNRMPTNSD